MFLQHYFLVELDESKKKEENKDMLPTAPSVKTFSKEGINRYLYYMDLF